MPYLPRPVRFSDSERWRTWLVTDQRSVADRTDVLTYQTPVLTAPVRISGAPSADLFAATTGTDSDWVVKLIDVFPEEMPNQPEMGGYQLAVSMDIFRGRYRESLEHPSAIPSGKPQRYRFVLPTTNHVFLRVIGLWCRSSPVGFRSTIETRKPTSLTSSSPNRRTT